MGDRLGTAGVVGFLFFFARNVLFHSPRNFFSFSMFASLALAGREDFLMAVLYTRNIDIALKEHGSVDTDIILLKT